MKRIIIDTDPGIDDSMAFLLACQSPEVKIEGLSTVYGNSSTENTTQNALRLVELAGREDIPVFRGAEKPLLRAEKGHGWRVHGRNGLGEIDFPKPKTKTQKRKGAQFIVDTILANPGEITLVTLGPLTNLALAVSLEPRISELVDEIILMGGAANGKGNATATAEANIYNDPEAAKIVFEAGWPLTMVGLDVTRKTAMLPEYVEKLRALDNSFTDFICKMLPYYQNFYKEVEGVIAFPVHDSSAMVYAIKPELFTTRMMRVLVETQSPHNAGLTSVDWRLGGDKDANVNVCLDVDSEGLLKFYLQRLSN